MDRLSTCTSNIKSYRLKFITILNCFIFLFCTFFVKAQFKYINLQINCCREINKHLGIQDKDIFLDSLSIISVLKFPLTIVKVQNGFSEFLKNVFDIDGLYQNDVIGELFYIGKLAGTSFESNHHHLLLFYQPKFNFADPDNFSLYLFNTYYNKITSIIEVASQLHQFDFIAYSKYVKLNNGELLIENISFPNDENEKKVKTVKYFKIDLLGKVEEINKNYSIK